MNLKQGYSKEPAEARKRFCRFLQLNPETLEEYKHWHNSPKKNGS